MRDTEKTSGTGAKGYLLTWMGTPREGSQAPERHQPHERDLARRNGLPVPFDKKQECTHDSNRDNRQSGFNTIHEK